MTDATSDNSAAAGGFTLVEVLMTVIVLVIAGTVVIPLMGSSNYSVAVGGARRVASDMQYAQDMAIATQKDITVTFDINRESYWLSNESGVLIHPISNNAYTTDFTADTELSQLDIVTVSGGGSVTFDPAGVPNLRCVVVLRAGSSTFNVTVSSITGTVSVAVDE